MIELIQDDGWDTQIAPGGRPRGFKAIEDQLLNHGLVTYSHGNTYLFLSASNSWSVFISEEAQVQLCNIVGSDSATVNYLKACIPYIGFLEKHALRTTSIPTSINIGTWRMSIFIKDDSEQLILQRAVGITPIDEGGDKKKAMDPRIGSFCVMPCSFNEIPVSWSPGGAERLLRYLAVLFPNVTSLHTIMWVIGNAVIDPGTSSRFLLLYGPGGTGKSTIIRVIESLLRGCSSTIKPGTLTDAKDDISNDTARAIASNRMLTAGEINLESNKLNLHNVKVMTGHDSIAVPPIKITTRCSIVAGCNDLPDPTKQKSWMTTAISRRVLVVLMNVNASLIPKLEMPDTVEDLQDFLLACSYIKLNSLNAPLSTRDALYSLLGYKYLEIIDKIEIDENASDDDIFDINTQLEIYLGIPLHSLGELAAVKTSNITKVIGNLHFLKGIKFVEGIETFSTED